MNSKPICFTVAGEPQGKGRPRFTRNGHAYTPQKTANYEELVRWSYRTQAQRGGTVYAYDVPLKVTIWAYMERPKSASRITRQLQGMGRLRPRKKPDWDNIGKIVCDALNGMAYHDDAQIVDGRVIKLFCADGEEPHVEVVIEEASNPREETE